MAQNRKQIGKGERPNKRSKTSKKTARAVAPRKKHSYIDRVQPLADALKREPDQSATVARLYDVLKKHPLFRETREKQRTVAGVWRQARPACIAAGIERDGLLLRLRTPKRASRNGTGKRQNGTVRARQKGSKRAIGRSYVFVDEKAVWEKREPFAAEMDPDVIDRGRRGHQRTQDSLANLVKAHGMEPLKPNGEPQFDVAWYDDHRIYVAEVKSLTKRNEENQLRLGLGQVLRYRQLLSERKKSADVRAVLAPEREPGGKGWQRLCRELDVILWWPGSALPRTAADGTAAPGRRR